MTEGISPENLAQLRRERERQGLPEFIEDETVTALVVGFVRDAQEDAAREARLTPTQRAKRLVTRLEEAERKASDKANREVGLLQRESARVTKASRPSLEEAAAEMVERTRREQGLPLFIEDEATIEKVAMILDNAQRYPGRG